MSKSVKISVIIWAVLALICFGYSFFIPVLFFKITGIAFGLFNMIVILINTIALFFKKEDVQLQEEN